MRARDPYYIFLSSMLLSGALWLMLLSAALGMGLGSAPIHVQVLLLAVMIAPAAALGIRSSLGPNERVEARLRPALIAITSAYVAPES